MNADSIAILSHVPPDGDALGSMLALNEAIRGMGKKDVMGFTSGIPFVYDFMPGIDLLRDEPVDKDFDLVILVDCSDVSMSGRFLPMLCSAKTIACLDHHVSNKRNADICLVDTTMSSASQVVFEFLLDEGISLTATMATNLYVGLSTDTGNFCHSNTNERTFEDAAKLVKAGADVEYITSRLYNRRTLIKTKLIAKAINNLEVLENGKIAIIIIDNNDKEELGNGCVEFEGIIDYAREIEGVEVAVLMRVVGQNKYKVSLRSNKLSIAGSIAESFDGGGHPKASGCTIVGTKESVREKILNEIKKVITDK